MGALPHFGLAAALLPMLPQLAAADGPMAQQAWQPSAAATSRQLAHPQACLVAVPLAAAEVAWHPAAKLPWAAAAAVGLHRRQPAAPALPLLLPKDRTPLCSAAGPAAADWMTPQHAACRQLCLLPQLEVPAAHC